MKRKILVLSVVCLLFSFVVSQDVRLLTMSEEQKRLQAEIDMRWKEHEKVLQKLKQQQFLKISQKNEQDKKNSTVKKQAKSSKAHQRVQVEINRLDKELIIV